MTRVNPALPSSSFTPSSVMWNKLWAIPTVPKVCMFMWNSGKLSVIGWLVEKTYSVESAAPTQVSQSVIVRMNLLNTSYFIVHGVRLFGLGVGKLFRFSTTKSEQRISGWRIFYVVA